MLKSLLNHLPPSLIVPDDGTVILSPDDVRRRRMLLVAVFGLILVLGYTGLQYLSLGLSTAGIFSLTTGLLGSIMCIVAIKVSLWREHPEPFVRVLMVIFSAMLWAEIAMSGGVTGYHAAIFPVLPVVSSLFLRTRDTVVFTVLNLVVILAFAVFEYATALVPTVTLNPDTHLLLVTSMLVIALFGCGGSAIVMAHQNERIEQQLRDLVEYQSHLAAHDHLSGLGNRIRLQERFDTIQKGDTFDLLLIDLDGFKAVNDTYGHNAGDYLIKSLAERLREVTDTDDLLVRLGGDEFVIMIENVDGNLASVRNYAEYLIEILSRPYPWQNHVLRISASIGHARFPHHGTSPSKILSLADKALYVAKDAGKSQCVTYGMKPAPKLPRRKIARTA